jgi:hypothetical protein
MRRRCLVAAAAGVLLISATCQIASAAARGRAGERVFPSTITIDDPFVSDELALPTVVHIKQPGEGNAPPGQITSISGELSKRIFPDLGLTLSGNYNILDPGENGNTQTGFGNLTVSVKYQFFTSDAHETVLSAAFGWEAGGTGKKEAGADSFDLFKPALLFAKGMGDLPEALRWLQPVAVIGVIEGVLPSRSGTKTYTLDDAGDLQVDVAKIPNVLHWGFAVMYSLPYLEQFVMKTGLPSVIRQLTPLVEIDINNPLDRGQAGKTTGTVNPGIIWAAKYLQVGVEAIVPINGRTGKNVGIRGQIDFYLDEIFPTTIGRPIFNWH